MPRKPTAVVAILTMSICNSGHTQTVIFDRSCATVEDRGITVSADRLTDRLAESICAQFVRSMAPHRALARLTIATDRESLMRALVHTSMHPSYRSTLDEIRSYQLPVVPVARVLVLNGAALFSYRDKAGYREHMLSKGCQSISFVVQGTTFDLLHFILTEPGPALQPSDYSLSVFLRAGSGVSVSACAGATRQMLAWTKLLQLHVEVRPDGWFMDSYDYPALLPFQESDVPPNELAFLRRPQVSCGYAKQTGILCSGHNFQP
jgi:hypothetical protein